MAKQSISAWAILNPIAPVMLFLLLTIAGLFAFADLPITNMPNVVVPVITVQVDQPGALPSEMEKQVTRKVERALSTLQGVRHITSNVSEGTSLTTVEFTLETDIDRGTSDTRDAMANIRNQLPEMIEEPLIRRQQESSEAILIYSVEAPEMQAEDLSWFIDDTLSRELLAIPGVARVTREGGVDQEITLSVDAVKLSALGINAADISRQLAQAHTDVPGGRLTLGGIEYALNTVGRASDLAQLRDMRVALTGGREVKLSDLGTVESGGGEARTITRLDGRPAITFSVFRTQAASEVTVAREVQAHLQRMSKARGDVVFQQILSQATFTETSYESTLYTLCEGVLLTLLIVFAFLRDSRATFITALAIPLSVIPTFLCLQWLGFTLNFVSLLAISLVTGALVDDAIVEIENIHRHMRGGKGAFEAAMEAADEIGMAVIATTLVICAVFIPVSFMGGVPGLYFRQFGLTVAIAAFFSLLVARLLTPLLAAKWLRPGAAETQKPENGIWMQRYLSLVAWTLRHRVKTLAIAAVTVALSFALVPLLPSGFMPYQDFSLASLTVELPQGSTLEEADAKALQVAKLLKTRPEVTHVLTTTGKAGSGLTQSKVTITLVPPGKRRLDERQFANAVLPMLAALPDVRIVFDNAAGRKDIAIALVGEDDEVLMRGAQAIERQMRGLPGLSGVGSSFGQKQPEITVAVDSVKAARLGITAQQIGEALNISTIGDKDVHLAKFNEQSRQIPIRVRLPPVSQDLGVLENLNVATPSGGSVPLSSLAALHFGLGPTTIERRDQQRRINLYANLNGIALGTALDQINALPAVRGLPASVQLINTEDAEFMDELMARFLKALGAGLLMVYAIQVLLYSDWLQPLTRMAALPLSIGGAFLMLFLCHAEFGLPAMLGILMLMGIADKNAILLVDHILEKMREGMPRDEAIMLACRVRARPIVMTSFAMTAGMLPVALGIGLDTSFRMPMAVAVVGGLVSSTALSLVFMPVLFSYVRDVENWLLSKATQGRSHASLGLQGPAMVANQTRNI